ncbi:uncharacterized protein EDB91DRAFT_1262549 [Suillus paluster]|uniref:uncharacterized protein n=1 Tax=Suillus paluster TaxID=48578 RepID=UPI001B87DA6A|nr:uncharacterized protein EDB91DRAFT_1262549 [Suillus paluster]KAG1756895.1 hypothetical protein EDB91DRAFT_1262549 [Suillus paluster]
MSAKETKEIQHIAAAVRVLRESAPAPTATLAHLETWGRMVIQFLDHLRVRRRHLLSLTIVQSLVTLFHDRVDDRRIVEWLRWGESWMPRTIIARAAPPPPSATQQLSLEVATLPFAKNKGKKRAATSSIDETNSDCGRVDGDDVDHPSNQDRADNDVEAQIGSEDDGDDDDFIESKDDDDYDVDFVEGEDDNDFLDSPPSGLTGSSIAARRPRRRLTRSSVATANLQQLLQPSPRSAAAGRRKSPVSYERPTKRARINPPGASPSDSLQSGRSPRKGMSVRALLDMYKLCQPRKVRFKCQRCQLLQPSAKPCLTVTRGASDLPLDRCARCITDHKSCEWNYGEKAKNLVYRTDSRSFYEPPNTSCPPTRTYSGSGSSIRVPPAGGPRRPLPGPKSARAKQTRDLHPPAPPTFSRPHFRTIPILPLPETDSPITTREITPLLPSSPPAMQVEMDFKESSEITGDGMAQLVDEDVIVDKYAIARDTIVDEDAIDEHSIDKIPQVHSYTNVGVQVPSPHPDDDVLYRTLGNHNFASLGFPPHLARINLRAIEDALSPMFTLPTHSNSNQLFLDTSGSPAIASLPLMPSSELVGLNEVLLVDRSHQYFNRLLINWANLRSVAMDLRTTARNLEAVQNRWGELQEVKANVQNRGSRKGVVNQVGEEGNI